MIALVSGTAARGGGAERVDRAGRGLDAAHHRDVTVDVHASTARRGTVELAPHEGHDNRCQCPHWGYVVQGSFTYRFADHDETVHAGDAFYLPPGHVPIANAPNSVIVQLSPTDEP